MTATIKDYYPNGTRIPQMRGSDVDPEGLKTSRGPLYMRSSCEMIEGATKYMNGMHLYARQDEIQTVETKLYVECTTFAQIDKANYDLYGPFEY